MKKYKLSNILITAFFIIVCFSFAKDVQAVDGPVIFFSDIVSGSDVGNGDISLGQIADENGGYCYDIW